MKKLITFSLILTLILSMVSFGYAAAAPEKDSVTLLKEAGLLKGTGTAAVNSDTLATRVNTAVLCLRLAGLEAEAAAYQGTDYYADAAKASWAKPIMAYLKAHPALGWNVENNQFDPKGTISTEEVCEKLISILGWQEEAGNDVLAYAKSLGISDGTNRAALTERQLADLVRQALSVKVKGSESTLAETLIEKGVLNGTLASQSGLIDSLSDNMYTVAVAWKQTAAEYKALYHQGYNIAREKVQAALDAKKPGDKPLAVVTDADDTIFNAVNYWGYLIKNHINYFDDPIWDEWVPENKMTPAPGSLEFFDFCKENGVEVFYVTSRDQGEKTYEYAIGNLKALGFPNVDDEHVTVLQDTSNKEEPQSKIAETYNLVVYLGDNLNDFRRIYYVKDVEERTALMEADKDLFGDKYILFPNPTDGHWITAIFGESEPAATPENQAKWEEAASLSSWK